MASKLDEAIARVAIEAASRDRLRLIATATEAAAQVKPADLAKLPDRWASRVSAKGAGRNDLRDAWPRLWFEGLVEVLCQSGSAGVAPLFELLERDHSTYHDLVLPRLLRMAAAGVEREAVLSRLETRLQTMHHTAIHCGAREVVSWSEHDAQPLELLRSFASLPVRNADGATIGAFVEQMEWELAQLRAQKDAR